MKIALMVAEKPSLAHSLAKILSNGSLSTRKGSNGVCSVHEWDGRLNMEPVHFKMTSVCGHVMSLDFNQRYNNWDKVSPAELYTACTEKKEATAKLNMPQFLAKEGRGVDFLVLWLDCDKEGENICFEVIDCVKPVMKHAKGVKVIFRAKFSAITDKDIKAAMNALIDPNENESLSVDARQELDLRVGCAFTRFQTRFFQGKYGDLDSTLISYGPCQTPTLGFCVAQHDEISSFKPEPFWCVHVKLGHKTGQSFLVDWSRVRTFDKDVALLFLNEVKECKEARIISVTKKEKVKQRPLALNTVEMLRCASSCLGMSPHYAMQVAERLYTQGYISYPRTETTSYPVNFDIQAALKPFMNTSEYGTLLSTLIAEGIHKGRKGHDAGDHPPITPMRNVTLAELGHESWKLYDFIVRHFIGTVSSDCKYMQTTVNVDIGMEKFTCTGKTLISPGYTAAITHQALMAEEKMPDVSAGDVCSIEQVKLSERQTTPPDYLTESELITMMEKHSIGTDASIPVHINNICERNYVQVIGASRRLQPTTLGIVLVHGYQKIDPDLVLPSMRSAVEKQLNLISQGKADYLAVLKHSISMFEMKYKYFVQQISAMDELFEVSFSPLSATGKSMSRCGQCNRFMKYVDTKPCRLHCSTCDVTYKLPQNGLIKPYQNLKCPIDNFELVMWTTGAKGKSYPLCPYCYNNPPLPGMKVGFGCTECTHPTCKHALSQNAVSCCVECEMGLLMLDRTSAPKWKLSCNKCNVVVNFQNEAQIHKLDLADGQCDQCEATLLKVTFNKDRSPLPDSSLERVGCVFCDAVLKQFVGLHHATMRLKSGSSSSRGRGRRGRGKQFRK